VREHEGQLLFEGNRNGAVFTVVLPPRRLTRSRARAWSTNAITSQAYTGHVGRTSEQPSGLGGGYAMRKLIRPLLAIAMLVFTSGPLATTASAGNKNPEWYLPQNHISQSADVLARVLNGNLTQSSALNSGSQCPAETSTTGNVQVNCRAEDDASGRNTQSETSVAAVGNKVVVGYNDSLVCCLPAINLSGYSVSTDGGQTFTDKGDLPWSGNVQPIGDPSLAADDQGNIFYATLAFQGPFAQSLIALYEMPVGSNAFRLLSIPINVGNARSFFADKELLAIGRDGNGQLHFYITWTHYAHSFVEGPVTLSDSTDGVNWRTTPISAANACAPTTPGSHPIPAGSTLYISWEQFDAAACATPNSTVTSGTQFTATVEVDSATVTRITRVARVHGAGDVITFCGFANLEVIETEPGHDSRLFEAPASTIDPNGTLYEVWNDRPLGPGGRNSNATRIFLSFSRDGNLTWSNPQVISGAIASNFMNDRYQPGIVVDSQGLHASWYERVRNSGGVGLLRRDGEDLTLATSTKSPMPGNEIPLSTVNFPIYQTNPNQDPIIAACYMGDYSEIGSNGTTRFATWGDNRNVVTTSVGMAENQADVFLQSF